MFRVQGLHREHPPTPCLAFGKHSDPSQFRKVRSLPGIGSLLCSIVGTSCNQVLFYSPLKVPLESYIALVLRYLSIPATESCTARIGHSSRGSASYE